MMLLMGNAESWRLRRAYESLQWASEYLAWLDEQLQQDLGKADRRRHLKMQKHLQRRLSKPVGWGWDDHLPKLYRWNRRPDMRGRRKRKRGKKQRGQRNRMSRTTSRKAKRNDR